MNLLTANLGAFMACVSRILRKLLYAVQICWMIIRQSCKNRTAERILRIDHEDFSYEASWLKRIVASSQDVLHSDLVCSLLAISRKKPSPQSGSRGSGLTRRILNVAQLVSDHKGQFSRIALKNTDEDFIECHHMSARIAKCIYLHVVTQLHGELWQFVLKNALGWISQTRDRITNSSFNILCCAQWREKQDHYQPANHKFLSAHIDRARRTIAGLTCTPSAEGKEKQQQKRAQRIIAALLSAARFIIIEICDGYPSLARHVSLAFLGVDILALVAWLWNGTRVPRTAGETA